MNYAHMPVQVGEEKHRDDLFALKDKGRTPPMQTHPFHQRTQDLQLRNDCTVYSFAEVFENKVYWDTGIWYGFPETEKKRLWELMKKMSLAGESWGAYVNSPMIAGKEDKFLMVSRKDAIWVTVDEFFIVAYKSDPLFLEKIELEIAYGGGVCSGINNFKNKLDYYGALKPPYIIKESENAREISHAMNLTHYNKYKNDLISSSGSWGDNVGDNGVLYINKKDVKKLFMPYGFTYKIVG